MGPKKVKVKVKKKKLKIKNIFIFLLFILIFISTVYYLINLPIKNIYIIGNNIVKDKEIIDLANLKDYPPYLKTYFSNIETKIKQNKYIKDVNIKRKLNGKIYIYISEYRPLYIYQDKLVLSSLSKEDNNYQIDYVPYVLNNIDDIYQEFTTSFSKVDNDIIYKISHIEYIPNDVDKERFIFYMVDSNYVYITLSKIEKINKYNSIIKELEGKKGIIYLDSGDYVEIKGWHKSIVII